MSYLNDLLGEDEGQSSATPTTPAYVPPTPSSSFNRGSYLSPDELKTIQGFAGVKRDPSGNYGGFDAKKVEGFQTLYNRLSPDSMIKVDGVHGNQTAAAAYDLLTRYGNQKPAGDAPTYTPEQEQAAPAYQGSPLSAMYDQFKPKVDRSEDQMRKASGWAALAGVLRNVVDATYGSQGAQIVQHTDPEWVMKLAQRGEQLKDQRKGEETRYNYMRLQQAIRDNDKYDAMREKIGDRNYQSRVEANREKYGQELKSYWHDRERGERESDYNRNKADQYTMLDKQTAKQKDLARFNTSLQEGAFEKRLKKMQELGVGASGKPVNGTSSGGKGKVFMTVSVNGQNHDLKDGEALTVYNWALQNKALSDEDLSVMKASFDGASKTLETKRIVQLAIGKYIKAQQLWQQKKSTAQTTPVQQGAAVTVTPQRSTATQQPVTQQQATHSTSTKQQAGHKTVAQQPVTHKTAGTPPSISVPKSVQLMQSNGMGYDEAMGEYNSLVDQGYSDEDIYQTLGE